MVQSLVLPNIVEVTPPARVNVPAVPEWVEPRTRIADRLGVGVYGLLTLLTGPAGVGKTVEAASWAGGAGLSAGVIWSSLAGGESDPDYVWRHLRNAWVEAGARDLPPLPPAGSAEPRRIGMLADFGAALRAGGPWVLVFDNYRTGTPAQFESDLETVMSQAQRQIRLVVLSRGNPAIAVHRYSFAGELTRINGQDLAMNPLEIAGVLRRHRVDATDATVGLVEQHTAGWASGVRHAATTLRDAPTVARAMHDTDTAIADYLAREVLAKVPEAVRKLIMRTSVVADVEPELAKVLLDAGPEVDLSSVDIPFTEVSQDGRLRCHPLLRSTALALLSLESPSVARDARRRAARWYADRGDATAAIELSTSAEDWPSVAGMLVESHSVPRIVAGVADEAIMSAARVGAVGAAEPVLAAAVALAHHDRDAARAALERAGIMPPTDARNALVHRFSSSFVGLADARLRGDVAAGVRFAEQTRELMARLPVAVTDDGDLSAMLDAHVGALEVWNGDLHAADLTLTRGASSSGDSPSSRAARSDCAGQLALLEAVRGNLRRATRHASAVMADAEDCARTGVLHASLATAWVHLERGEYARARESLDRAASLRGNAPEPWTTAVSVMAEARLRTATGQPEAALRLLGPALTLAGKEPQSCRLAGLLAIVSAEALLAAGEPQLALTSITPVPSSAVAEACVLAACAHRDVGDLRGARAALARAAAGLCSAPLGFQIESWLLDGQLAQNKGETERARLLADRALRAAGEEGLVRPFSRSWAWLRAFVDRDATLLRTHREFLASLSLPGSMPRPAKVQPCSAVDVIVETLTQREVEVLELLAQMSSTDEIAGELYISVNTVKTHMKGIFRKLGVNRRVDAVRRGRVLGLC